MAKLSKAGVKEKLAEYAVTVAKLNKAESAQNAELDPLLVEYNEAAKPILAKHEKKIGPLRAKADELSAEIYGFLDGQTADVEIEMSGYVAQRRTQSRLMARVIDVKKFLEMAKKKGEAMYACITIGVKKAEDLLGKEIDLISERPTKTEVTVALRQK